MEGYNYPDEGDKLTTLFIEKNSDNQYWEDSEKNVLEIMINEIKDMPNKPRFLDLGCGMGRLFPVFYPYVERITGVEPDLNRYKEAMNEAERIDNEKINVLNGDISVVQEKTFDVVLTSHIFQHMKLDIVKDIISRLSKIIPPNGLLCITTTFTGKEKDILSIEYLENGKRISKIVDENEFINSFDKDGILPVRFFSINTVKNILEENGFVIQIKAGYHFEKKNVKENLSVELDNRLNELEDIQFARDIMYTCKRV